MILLGAAVDATSLVLMILLVAAVDATSLVPMILLGAAVDATSLVPMILLGAAVDASAITTCKHFTHVTKVTMMVIVLTNILPQSDTCDQILTCSC